MLLKLSIVWHEGLLHKLKKNLPKYLYELIKSYLEDRTFRVKYNEETTRWFPIKGGVPQGSVLGPTLYLLYTADLPTTQDIITATYADDTAILTSHSDADIAANQIQNYLNEAQKWLKNWRIKVNESKSTK